MSCSEVAVCKGGSDLRRGVCCSEVVSCSEVVVCKGGGDLRGGVC